MLKLKITVSILAMAGVTILILGSTYMSAAVAIICTGVASSLALDITLKWTMPEEGGLNTFLLSVWTLGFILAAAYVIKQLGAYDTPLSAPIDLSKKIEVAGDHVLSMNVLSVLMAVIAPWTPKGDRGDEG